MKFTWAASWSLNVLTGQRSTPHWTPVTDADDGVTVGAIEAVGVGAGEAVGVLDGESLPHADAARSSVAASQPTKIRTQFRGCASATSLVVALGEREYSLGVR